MTDHEADFARLWLGRVKQSDICAALDMLSDEVLAMRKRLKLPPRPRGGIRANSPEAERVRDEVVEARARRREGAARPLRRDTMPGWTEAQDLRLRAARRYRERAELAAQWGKPIAAVEARFQRVRA